MSDASSQQKQQDPKQTGRIPVRMILLHDEIDLMLPNGNSVRGRIDCGAGLPGRPFVIAHFVPAHQVIEAEFYRSEKMEPYRTRIPLSGVVKRFD